MPKIRCSGCEAVLNLPDKAAGKVAVCPKCGTKLKVPGGPAKAAAAAKKRKKRKAAPATDTEDVFGNIDLDRMQMEAEGVRICPYCAQEMDAEDPVCRSCGMNIETGKMDTKEEKRRSRKGPDPAKFYGKAWSDSWSFLKENRSMAIRTGMSWTMFAVLNAMCAYMGFIYVEALPPKVFWIGMTILTGLGIPGWYWVLGLKVIHATVLREQFRADRIHFDLFTSVASGVRAIFWPLIVMGPFTLIFVILFIVSAALFQNPAVIAAMGLCIVAVPLLLLPIAMVHMTAKYSYKGWILWELLKVLPRNFGPTLYFHIVAFATMLPVMLLAGGIILLIKNPNPFASEVILGINDKITLWIMKLVEAGQDPESWTYMFIKAPLNIAAAFLVLAPIYLLAGFPALFLMRANGLFGLYNQRALDLVQQMKPGTPATFWVRYLAHTIDELFVPLASLLVTANPKALMLGWAVNGIGLVIFIFSRPMFVPLYVPIWTLYMNWMYWAVQESSELRTTLGKDAFGLIVVTEDDKQLNMKQASGKWALRIIFDVIGGIPYLSAAFHPEKKSLHDIMTKTKVVWKGDR